MTVKNETDYWNNSAKQDPYFAVWSEPDYVRGTEACVKQVDYLIQDMDKTVIDIGCGVGRILIPLALKHPDTTFYGVDMSEEMLIEARKRSQPNIENVDWLLNDGRTLPPFLDTDLIYSMLTFQHMTAKTITGYLTQISFILKPGGIFRFQYVVGTEDGPMNHQLADGTMELWCEQVGLHIDSSELGLIYPEWKWVTAVKP